MGKIAAFVLVAAMLASCGNKEQVPQVPRETVLMQVTQSIVQPYQSCHLEVSDGSQLFTGTWVYNNSMGDSHQYLYCAALVVGSSVVMTKVGDAYFWPW